MSDYHLDYDAWSKTMLSHLVSDPYKAYRYYVKRDIKPPDLSGKRIIQVGDLCHQVLLERKDVDDLVVFYPQDCFKSNGHLNPKPAKEFRESQPHKTVVKDEDYKRVVQCCNAVMRHQLGDLLKLEGVQFEQPYYWRDDRTGIPCRAKADFSYEDEREVLIYDLKFTEDVRPGSWARVARRFRYWLQDAHYSAGQRALTGKPATFVFWAVETHWPFRVVKYQYDEISRERAFSSRDRLLESLKVRIGNNDWAPEWEGKSNYLTLEPWEAFESESEIELEGFEDDETDTKG